MVLDKTIMLVVFVLLHVLLVDVVTIYAATWALVVATLHLDSLAGLADLLEHLVVLEDLLSNVS
jgi:hypothetical protein